MAKLISNYIIPYHTALYHTIQYYHTHNLILYRTYTHVQEEHHMVNGELKKLLVHRKGSTRAFPPHHPLIPADYQFIGQPVLIGGTYVLYG